MPEADFTLPPEITSEALLRLRPDLAPHQRTVGGPAISPAAEPDTHPGTASPILLDVREPWEFATAALQGATLIPMSEIPSRAHTELDPDQPIVVLCHHGARSLSVTMWLRQQGFDHAQSLAGGIDHWSRTIDPTIPRY